ncbi:MAG: flavocytochrome C [Betaproteobacteria bacterium RIFCSPLOWO2_12_FULL_62_58]|nr:MAG: flavocytochrome C [Betaproteobacteria bacterium RIFCSPLOWO2_02_FULL_62_79]OGA54954.1 MAG: flavocytochrome C [Betaproteobacteria bacterium RIFCSPLOWO2_12_FULL_62_58]
MTLTRREFIKWLSATAGVTAVAGCATPGTGGGARVVVIGGGYGGATAARHIKLWAPDIDVTVVERNTEFVSCPISNLVLGGNTDIGTITMGYEGLRKRGVRVVRDEAVAVDPANRQVRLKSGATLGYDRLIVSPGIDFGYEQIPALNTPEAQAKILHAWKAGAQTVALRKQLEAMRDGGVYAIQIPKSPYRCPPGPYERACQVAFYFKARKPKSKVLILDANEDVQSKKGLFMAAWNGPYKGIVEYRPNMELQDVDVKTNTAIFIGDKVRAEVLNVVPAQTAGEVAHRAGLANVNKRWCGVDWLTMESVAVKGVHVLGDATLSAPAMPKSASMANQHAKVCAAAVIALLKGQPVNQRPVMMNTCYSFVSDSSAMHVASVHQYDAAQKAVVPVKGAGGVSGKASELEAAYAWGWAKNIWGDALG